MYKREPLVREEVVLRVLRVLRAHGFPLSTTEIQEAAGMRYGEAAASLRRLAAKGIVERIEVEGYRVLFWWCNG